MQETTFKKVNKLIQKIATYCDKISVLIDKDKSNAAKRVKNFLEKTAVKKRKYKKLKKY